MINIRVGQGIDVHQLKEGTAFWLGGIEIAHNKGAVGHSDADVLIHAICDALLGAANLRDIGFHFPDTSASFKGIDSKILLKEVVRLISEKGWKIGNVDSTLLLEKPKISPYIDRMKETLAAILNIESDAVSIKATTNEQLGYIGREEGVQAFATALIYKD
jgi:2-C-methyl-D-erythritol 2,4-cyclodiphosphate synthase